MSRDRIEDRLRLCEARHEQAKAGDVAGVLGPYHPDAEPESPLIPALLGRATGVCREKDEITCFPDR